MSNKKEPVAFWERWWSGDKSGPKDGKYHSNNVTMNLDGISLNGKNLKELSGKEPIETTPNQWYEVVPLFTKDMLQEK